MNKKTSLQILLSLRQPFRSEAFARMLNRQCFPILPEKWADPKSKNSIRFVPYGEKTLPLPAAASRRPTQANAHTVHMHGASQRPKYTNTHMHMHTYTHACIVCILGVSIFWRHYPMYFINSSSSSSSSACRSTRLPRRQVPVMEYTHNIQHTNTHRKHNKRAVSA